jgi:hypothetical protein
MHGHAVNGSPSAVRTQERKQIRVAAEDLHLLQGHDVLFQ